MNPVIIGHANILRFFETALKNGSLSHAYGFVGPSSIGKKAVASELAAKILGVNSEKLLSHPDYILVERGQDEKTGKLKKVITIEQARNLKTKLQNTVWGGGNRAVVVDRAELLNDESGNALLKLLEDPPKNTTFFLIIQNEASLLVTIKSRLQVVYFSLVSRKEIEAGLKAVGFEADEAALFARRSLGKPGKALVFREERENYEELFGMFQQISGSPFYKKVQMIGKLYGDKEDGERGREQWQKILDQWMIWVRDSLLKKHGTAEYAAEPAIFSAVNYSDRDLVRIIDSITAVKKLLKENINPRLAIEETLLKIK